jgi:glucokinase
MRVFVMVSGLPASGKTTLAAALAHQLQLPHLDKDYFLEGLFSRDDPPSLEGRAKLSREADAAFRAAALRSGAAVLSSWWQHPLSKKTSGTSTDWLLHGQRPLVEIHCQCPASIALRRFIDRKRHESHADELRNRRELEQQFAEAAALGPLFPDRAISISTVSRIEQPAVQDLASRLSEHVSAHRDA